MDKCEPWHDCLEEETRMVLIKVLKAYKAVTSKPALIENNESSPGGTVACPSHRTCLDPSSMDVESFECECFQQLEGKDEAEIKEMTCNRKDVCCAWKKDNCPEAALEAGSSLIQRSQV